MNLVNGLYWHPKMMKAVSLLHGQASHAEVFTFHVLALSYAHQHLTDGYLPQPVVENLWIDCAGGVSRVKLRSNSGQTPVWEVVKVLSSRQVRLWHSCPGGWVIHDYLKHNPSASAVKTKREKNRQKQADWRAKQ